VQVVGVRFAEEDSAALVGVGFFAVGAELVVQGARDVEWLLVF
jgi:hypothetical protein